MSIGKYVTNPGVLGAAAGALSTAKRTQSMRKDWRRYIVWGVWAAGLALAIAGVAMQEAEEDPSPSRLPRRA
ncbi:hypothetical protein G7067_11920 [Leucobacter insecticola]|uniref:Uncharacterized protein n=1 Tax=Leucobacter insecticola TaxID=2714934 RepID=A0A6G8FKY4_9MICO|nr:hypothetical protein [Leucobacter insecticola]QIM16949.1 hypothetical protein G7067_11920 [Leucobacter insecticola]